MEDKVMPVPNNETVPSCGKQSQAIKITLPQYT